ncbi:rRNA maturation RNase YbeY [Fundicoccus culcitae]|uniref:Endoribonuclease YbeY n=1 Tax=Fundicoccus culcitae TaxID=2969821 RepID=A0ABY5P6J5_9LACT|nr:rRNA maturation RNase YbeY [Fundicoccus culcitae]UUX34356.1 rRNA maturation RNase YbeY [Fundicoccus culcitae]
MLIEIIDDANYLTDQQTEIIEAVIELAAKRLQLGSHVELDISLVSNEDIHDLNKTYRQIDRPTDVLSFALNESIDDSDQLFNQFFDSEDEASDLPLHLGDIIISYPKAVEQAEDYGHSLDRELAFLAVHGFLHLNGYDHQTEEDSKEMFAIQEEVLQEYGLSR